MIFTTYDSTKIGRRVLSQMPHSLLRNRYICSCIKLAHPSQARLRKQAAFSTGYKRSQLMIILLRNDIARVAALFTRLGFSFLPICN